MGGAGTPVPHWNTVTTGSDDLCTAHSDIRLTGTSVSVPFAAKSVQTLRLDGVTVQPARPRRPLAVRPRRPLAVRPPAYTIGAGRADRAAVTR
ncbi:hypothetical protein [Streptomyces incanus]|uniref:Uncharacterized protein n=1 Tax=Streptomyces incanus TaxID=887453 RepID=A0ABW0Y4V7_9ACTN